MKDWTKALITPKATISEALKTIDSSSAQIAMVIDNNKQLLGVATDGDIRRALLKGFSLETPIEQIMNTSPITFNKYDDRRKILNLMRRVQVHHIPIVDSNGCLVGLEVIDDFTDNYECENHVVLMAGGLGSRLRPLTDNCPKPLLKVGNKPLIQTIVESFIEQGFKNFYISVNYLAERIKEHFGDGSSLGIEIKYLTESKKLGTAGALGLLPNNTDKPFIVMNGDILTKVNFNNLLKYHCDQDAVGTMCVREYNYQIPYGVVHVDNDRLINIEEKPVQNVFVSGGIYVFNPEVLNLFSKNEEIDMPNLFKRIIEKGNNVSVYPINEYWLDIGKISDFKKANGEYYEMFK